MKPKETTARDIARQREQAGFADGWMGRPLASLVPAYVEGHLNGSHPCQCAAVDHYYGCRRRTHGRDRCAYCQIEHAREGILE